MGKIISNLQIAAAYTMDFGYKTYKKAAGWMRKVTHPGPKDAKSITPPTPDDISKKYGEWGAKGKFSEKSRPLDEILKAEDSEDQKKSGGAER